MGAIEPDAGPARVGEVINGVMYIPVAPDYLGPP